MKEGRRFFEIVLAVLFGGIGLPNVALAHPGVHNETGLAANLWHFASHADHVLPIMMFALGLALFVRRRRQSDA